LTGIKEIGKEIIVIVICKVNHQDVKIQETDQQYTHWVGNHNPQYRRRRNRSHQKDDE
jgi:hypothetical protein